MHISHPSFKELMFKLGYAEQLQGGYCYGYSILRAEAIANNTQSELDQKLSKISEYKDSDILLAEIGQAKCKLQQSLIQSIKTKIRQGIGFTSDERDFFARLKCEPEQLKEMAVDEGIKAFNTAIIITENDRALLSLLPLFDQIDLYHRPQAHPELFTEPVQQLLSSQKLSPRVKKVIASGKNLDNDNGLTMQAWHSHIFDRKELKQYLSEMRTVLPKDAALVIAGGRGHAVCLQNKGDHWFIDDINQARPMRVDDIDAAFILFTAVGETHTRKEKHRRNSKEYAALNFIYLKNGLDNSLKASLDKIDHEFNADVINIHRQNSLGVNLIDWYEFTCESSKLQQIDFNQVDKQGYSPLFNAARYGSVQLVQRLLDLGASVNNSIRSPLFAALKRPANTEEKKQQRKAIFRLLRNKGASITQFLVDAHKEGESKIAKHILEHYPNPPFILDAVALEDTKLLDFLIEQGVRINLPGPYQGSNKSNATIRISPLGLAVKKKNTNIFIKLLSAGASFYDDSQLSADDRSWMLKALAEQYESNSGALCGQLALLIKNLMGSYRQDFLDGCLTSEHASIRTTVHALRHNFPEIDKQRYLHSVNNTVERARFFNQSIPRNSMNAQQGNHAIVNVSLAK